MLIHAKELQLTLRETVQEFRKLVDYHKASLNGSTCVCCPLTQELEETCEKFEVISSVGAVLYSNGYDVEFDVSIKEEAHVA